MSSEYLADSVLENFKQGKLLVEISVLLQISIQKVISLLSEKSGLPFLTVETIVRMKECGVTYEQIKEEVQLPNEALEQLFTTIETESCPPCVKTPLTDLPLSQPEFVYHRFSGVLYKTSLISKKIRYMVKIDTISSFSFSCFNEAPHRLLYFIGESLHDQLKCLDITRDFAITHHQMNCVRGARSLAFYKPHIYVIGGRESKECERYSRDKDEWEALPPLPIFTPELLQVATLKSTQCLYVFGFEGKKVIRAIQRLSLTCLVWEVLELKLPNIAWIPVLFKIDESQVFFAINHSLFTFQPSRNTLKLVKSLPHPLYSTNGNSYYSNGFVVSISNYLNFQEIGELVVKQ